MRRACSDEIKSERKIKHTHTHDTRNNKTIYTANIAAAAAAVGRHRRTAGSGEKAGAVSGRRLAGAGHVHADTGGRPHVRYERGEGSASAEKGQRAADRRRRRVVAASVAVQRPCRVRPTPTPLVRPPVRPPARQPVDRRCAPAREKGSRATTRPALLRPIAAVHPNFRISSLPALPLPVRSPARAWRSDNTTCFFFSFPFVSTHIYFLFSRRNKSPLGTFAAHKFRKQPVSTQRDAQMVTMSAYSQFGYAYPTTGGQQVSEPVLAVRRYKKIIFFFSDTVEHRCRFEHPLHYLFIYRMAIYYINHIVYQN